jgi:ribose/xylose/arabinose/galactoside ABC-type transport system permease subunit
VSEGAPLLTLSQVIRHPVTRALLSLLLVFGVGMVFSAEGTFFKWDTHRDMLRQVSVIGILACGSTLVIIAGGIDLSVGSVLGLCAVLYSLFSIQWGWPALPAILGTLAVGITCGALSGGVIARFNMQPFIATLGMMVFARGVAKLVSGGQKISTAVQQQDGTYQYVEVPRIFDVLSSRIAGENVAVVTVVLLVCLVFCWILLTRMEWGRHLYAIGGNEEAARYAGIPVGRVKIFAYSLCGLFCAIAGICQAVQEQQGDPEAGTAYELSAIAMVVIGGTSLRGGLGSIGLTGLGILIIGYLEKILSINAVGEETRLMLTGIIIVAAVLFQKGET